MHIVFNESNKKICIIQYNFSTTFDFSITFINFSSSLHVIFEHLYNYHNFKLLLFFLFNKDRGSQEHSLLSNNRILHSILNYLFIYLFRNELIFLFFLFWCKGGQSLTTNKIDYNGLQHKRHIFSGPNKDSVCSSNPIFSWWA